MTIQNLEAAELLKFCLACGGQLIQVLEVLEGEDFWSPGCHSCGLTFSAGVAHVEIFKLETQ